MMMIPILEFYLDYNSFSEMKEETKKIDEPMPSTSRDPSFEESQTEKSSTSKCDGDNNILKNSEDSKRSQPISSNNVKLLNSVIKDLLVVVEKKL